MYITTRNQVFNSKCPVYLLVEEASPPEIIQRLKFRFTGSRFLPGSGNCDITAYWHYRLQRHWAWGPLVSPTAYSIHLPGVFIKDRARKTSSLSHLHLRWSQHAADSSTGLGRCLYMWSRPFKGTVSWDWNGPCMVCWWTGLSQYKFRVKSKIL